MNRAGKWAGCLTALATLSLPGCGPGKDSPKGTTQESPVLALIAASTNDAVREIAGGFTRETGVEVKLSPDDSSRLANQIVNGAPADLFLSANEKWADFVKDRGFALQTKALLGNTLVLIVPRGNPAGVARPEDLTTAAVKKVALAGPTVPAGIYARQALTRMKLLGDLEKQKKIVAGENVRVALAYVERGEVEAGIVYGTDAKITDKVEVAATFAPATHEAIIYPLVLLKPAQTKPGARRFFEYLEGPEAARVFGEHGFTLLSGNKGVR